MRDKTEVKRKKKTKRYLKKKENSINKNTIEMEGHAMKTIKAIEVSKSLGWGLKVYRPLFQHRLRRSWKVANAN